MQNPFRNRDHGYRPESQDDRWEARDRSRDEGSSWGNGDGGRVADRFRGQAQGHDAPDWRAQSDRSQSDRSQYDPSQYDRSQSDHSMSGSRGWGYGQDQQSRYGQGHAGGYKGDRGSGGPSYGASGYGQGREFEERAGSSYSGDYGRSSQAQGGDYGRRDLYQRDQGYGQGRAEGRHPEHAYAPGSQIWEGQGQSYDHHSQASDFEPDYLHWRNQQISNFDRDYSEWRTERRQKFSSDFDTWRQDRPRTEASGETRTPAENPVVGDISDGGTGDVKKR